MHFIKLFSVALFAVVATAAPAPQVSVDTGAIQALSQDLQAACSSISGTLDNVSGEFSSVESSFVGDAAVSALLFTMASLSGLC